MAGTIVIDTNLSGLYYNLTFPRATRFVRKDSSFRENGETETPAYYIEYHAPLFEGTTSIPVDKDGGYQVTIIDLDDYYGGGQRGTGVTIKDGNTVTVPFALYDADGNPLAPNRPIAPPNVEPPVEEPPVEEPPIDTGSEDDQILDLLVRLIKAVLRLFRRR
jgi:hypothetical protein